MHVVANNFGQNYTIILQGIPVSPTQIRKKIVQRTATGCKILQLFDQQFSHFMKASYLTTFGSLFGQQLKHHAFYIILFKTLVLQKHQYETILIQFSYSEILR